MAELAEDDLDAPINMSGDGARILTRRIMEDTIIASRGIKEPMVIEPTSEVGVYTVPNAILTTRFVDLSEVYEATGHHVPPID